MDKMVDFYYKSKVDCCDGELYNNFIDYAFEEADYFMLVYSHKTGYSYSKKKKEFKKLLDPYRTKSRSNPSWPGMLKVYDTENSYCVVFYHCVEKAKEILKQVPSLDTWSGSQYPQDLAFFKGNTCWFYSIGHENMASMIHVNEKDLCFLDSVGLANSSTAYDVSDYYSAFNEVNLCDIAD